MTYTIVLKLEKGVPAGCGRLGGVPMLRARPGPRPAPPAPPPAPLREAGGGGALDDVDGPMILSRVRPMGLARLADADMPGGGRADLVAPNWRLPSDAVAALSPPGALPMPPERIEGGPPAGGGLCPRDAIWELHDED